MRNRRYPIRVRTRAAALVVLATLALAASPVSAAGASAVSDDEWFTSPTGQADYAQSAELAYEFLDERVDEYCSADGLCLPRSYQGGYFTTPTSDFTASFVYDDALIVMAYVARSNPEDIRRARAIGDALLFLQENDPAGDGRTRASYEPASLRDGRVEIGGAGTFTGNQAWAGMALARLYAVTGEQKYLDGAVRLGEWIQANTSDITRPPFGYTGGHDADGAPATFKSTEHNIDVTAFFAQLDQVTGDRVWLERASVAADFVAAMQQPDGHLATGTQPDGASVNGSPIPEDPQTWSFLATGEDRYDAALDWAIAELPSGDGPYRGTSFSDADRSKVWFEGNGHLALALRMRDAPGDEARVDDLLASVELAQRQAPNGDGKGIVAASSDGLETGFDDRYYASLHTGATAWYLLAITGLNPFVLADGASDVGATPEASAPTADPPATEGSDEAIAPWLLPVVAVGALALAAGTGILLLRRRRR